jgi:hypothetical protein
MEQKILFAAIIGVTITAIVIRHRLWVRVVAVLILAYFATAYVMGLQTCARLATRQEYERRGAEIPEEWQDGAYKTRLVVQRFHPLGVTLFVSLFALALTPPNNRKSANTSLLTYFKKSNTTF